ncbi:ABC transporter permease [Zobellella sp. DQSA1]|uniref:ABC transporter permease n=1 Tax=Zobellella sp. DQSA1 TaxID=3342386 RepID=UPI0035BFC0BF
MTSFVRISWALGLKELASLLRDPVMLLLILYTFTLAIYSVAKGANTEVRNAAIAIQDLDHSPLSEALAEAFLPPYFKPPLRVDTDAEINRLLELGEVTFVLQIPPRFSARVHAGEPAELALQVDASAMSQAGIGAGYVEQVLVQALSQYGRTRQAAPLELEIRAWFNPNLDTSWFMSVMQLVNNVTLLAIILTGAAVIREREHGTLEHLLVMPLSATHIMVAKIWANGLVILAAAMISLYAVVQGLLGVPIPGSIALFAFGSLIYLGSVTALGIWLATLARTMPQFGLLAIPVFVLMQLLSGGVTPLDSMPEPLQGLMQFSPSTHYVAMAQAILYRGAGMDVVWPQLLAIVTSALVFFILALRRFRNMVAG